VQIALELVICIAFCRLMSTLWIGITFEVHTGVRIRNVVRAKTPRCLAESCDSLMVAVCMGSQRYERNGVIA
jgi:hypothetical protein